MGRREIRKLGIEALPFTPLKLQRPCTLASRSLAHQKALQLQTLGTAASSQQPTRRHGATQKALGRRRRSDQARIPRRRSTRKRTILNRTQSHTPQHTKAIRAQGLPEQGATRRRRGRRRARDGGQHTQDLERCTRRTHQRGKIDHHQVCALLARALRTLSRSLRAEEVSDAEKSHSGPWPRSDDAIAHTSAASPPTRKHSLATHHDTCRWSARRSRRTS